MSTLKIRFHSQHFLGTTWFCQPVATTMSPSQAAVAESGFFPMIPEFPWKEVLVYSPCDCGDRRGVRKGG